MLSGYHGVTGEGEGVISAIVARSYKHLSNARAAGPGNKNMTDQSRPGFLLAALSPHHLMPPTVTLLTQSPKLLDRVNIDPPHSSLKCFILSE